MNICEREVNNMKKLWVIGIICLFFGVGVFPAVAVETDNQGEDDCGCEDVNNIHLDRMGILIDRLEGYIKSLLVLSKRNPVVYGKCLKVSDEITTISNTYEELSYTFEWNHPIFCFVWEIYYNLYVAIKDLLIDITDYLYQFYPLFEFLANTLRLVAIFMIIREVVFVYEVGADFGCWD